MVNRFLPPCNDVPSVRLSIVVPVHNEQEVLEAVVEEIRSAFEPVYPDQMELIIVIDGSTDNSLAVLKHLQRRYPFLYLVSFEKNLGQSAAIWFGLQQSRGEILATMDGDGQYDPSDLLRIVNQVESGYQFSMGHRCGRQDSFSKRVFSQVGNAFRRWLTGSVIADSGCSLRAFKRELLCDLVPFRGLHRFLPTLFESANRRFSVVRVSHFPRNNGSSHYGYVGRGALGIADCVMLWWLNKRRFPIHHSQPQILAPPIVIDQKTDQKIACKE
jgi:dolichol-phosphate mannosyltransferase